MPNLRLLKFYMPDLRFLKFYMPMYYHGLSSKVHLDQGLESFPKELRYLHWHQYPLKTLPFHFKPKSLIELNLPFSKVEQLWQGEKKAFKLKFMDLSHSQNLTRMPDLSETPNLERIDLSNCTNLVCFPSSIQNFNHLSMLCFKGCKSLRSFPSNLHFVCQVTIDFSSCVNLTEFPMISGKIKRLYLCDTAIEEVPSSIECLADLKNLDLRRCTRLKKLSTRICKLKSLLELRLNDCLNLERFPEILEKMENLKRIYLERTAITELPSSIENLQGLESLVLEGCSKLDYLPDTIGNLKSLQYIYASGSALTQLTSSVADSNGLEQISLSGCRVLVSLSRLSPSGLSSLVHLELRDCAAMEIPQDIGCLSSLEWLDLSGNNFESLPASIKQLSQLIRLDLSNCSMLQSLPELPLFLRDLEASNCKRLQSLPEIPSCPDTSILEKISKNSYNTATPPTFKFANCMKLNETVKNKILAELQLRIQHLAIASLRIFYKEVSCKLTVPNILFPGSKIPDWLSNQSSGSLITIQLPQHFRRTLIGFALCVVLDFKQVPSKSWGYFDVRCQYSFEIKTLSQTKHVDVVFHVAWIPLSVVSDHVVIGFYPCGDVVLPDDNYHTTVSFEFFAARDKYFYKVKCCGVCPVYETPNETKPNTSTLKFAVDNDTE